MDFIFLQFYIRKSHDQSVGEYFSIGKQSVSDWRTDNYIPPKRLIEFLEKEGSLDPLELIKKIY